PCDEACTDSLRRTGDNGYLLFSAHAGPRFFYNSLLGIASYASYAALVGLFDSTSYMIRPQLTWDVACTRSGQRYIPLNRSKSTGPQILLLSRSAQVLKRASASIGVAFDVALQRQSGVKAGGNQWLLPCSQFASVKRSVSAVAPMRCLTESSTS